MPRHCGDGVLVGSATDAADLTDARRRARPAASRWGISGGLVMKQKPDGFRVIVFVRAGSVVVQSRGGANLAPGFPEIAEAASAIGEDVVLNGELVVAYQDRLDFTELQRRASRTGRGAARATLTRPAHVIVFDVLEADGVELLDRPIGSAAPGSKISPPVVR
jgi:ATP-dependent DNA ligase